MLPEETQRRLEALGARRLAEELIRLARRLDEAHAALERLLATPEENRERFLKKLAKLRRARKFYDWQAARLLAWELEEMLEDLRAACPEPKEALELLAKFYACDRRTLNRCDDSGGWVGGVFSHRAVELFGEFAARCQDKAWVAELVFRLYLEDDYGVRSELLTSADRFLGEEERRALAERLWNWARENPQRAEHALLGVELLAKGLKDPRLFERAALAKHDAPPPGLFSQIAEVYLEADEPEEALYWLEKAPPPAHPYAQDRHDRLLYEIYGRLGKVEEQAEVAWRIFRRSRSVDTLKLVLAAVGEERREEIAAAEVREILGSERFSYESCSLLIALGRLAEAEEYVLKHRERLDGSLYWILVPWARALEGAEHYLGATAIYRALLDSILERANTKYYHHGVRYLRKLEGLAPKIRDWRGVPPHEEYLRGLREAHGRKRSFWARYTGE